MAIYILTSTETILEVDVRPQESIAGDSVATGLLSLQLKQRLSSASFEEQQAYLSASATAAYVSLNKLDQRQRYRASVNIHPIDSDNFNFAQGSSSSGLGYALSIFDVWWRIVLKKPGLFSAPIFATGEILTSGEIRPISHFSDKIDSVCRYVEAKKDDVSRFYLAYPEENDSEITKEQRERLTKLSGTLVPAKRLQNILGKLLNDAYDGDPLGRWQPFKGLDSFNYEDSVRFFGREKDTERLYEDLDKNDGLLIVSGASGTGKSSLIKAGLIPRLEKETESLHWASTTPNSAMMNKGILSFIVDQMNIAWGLDKKGLSSELIISTLTHSIDEGIVLINSNISEETECCLLYFDQYEEVFNQASQEGKDITQDLELIDLLARKIKPLNIILALRNEYLGVLLDRHTLQSPIVSNVASQLSSDDWYEIVHEQASFSGISFEQRENGDVLDKIIVEEALKTPFALPMVEFLLEQLYLMAVKDDSNATVLRFKDHEKLGGLAGAIAGRASELINTSKYRDSLEKLFEAFVGLNGESLPYAKLVNFKKSDIDDSDLYMLIQEFVDANLIVSVTDNTKRDVVKLAHDRLFLTWIELKEWIKRSNAYLIWRYSIDGQFSQWSRSTPRESKAYLLRDSELLKRGRRFKSEGFINDVRLGQYVYLSEKKRSRNIAGLIVAVLLVPLIYFTTYYLNEVRIVNKYYSTIGERWGIPFGINELTKEQVSHRIYSYRLEYQGGILKAVAHQNSVGSLTPDDKKNNVSLWEYKYTEDGSLLTVLEKNQLKKILRERIYTFHDSNAVVEFKKKLGSLDFNKIQTSSEYLFGRMYDKKLLTTNSDITQHYIEYTNDGLLAVELYQNPYGIGVSINNEYYGTKYEYYYSGQLHSKTQINQDGSVYIGDNQVERTEYYYDDLGFLDKEKVITERGFRFKKFISDKWGNVIEQLVLGSDNGVLEMNYLPSVISREIDVKGNINKISTLDSNRKLKEMQYGVAVISSNYDAKGRAIEEAYYDAELNKTERNDNYVKISREYNSDGNVKSENYYDSNNLLVLARSGCSGIEYSYNSEQNITNQKCFGLDGLLAKDRVGVAEYVAHYHGLAFEFSMFDEKGSLVMNNEGFARFVSTRNKNGRVIEESYFGINGNPVSILGESEDLSNTNKNPELIVGGFAKVLSKYDKHGNLSELTFEGPGGQRTSVDGAAKVKWVYDDLGRRIEESYYDLHDQPVSHYDMGYFKKITVYSDSENLMISENFYNELGNIIYPITNYHIEDDSNAPLKKVDVNIKIFSIPSFVDVYIDNVFVGTTPYSGAFTSGLRKVELKKGGYLSVIKVIDADPSQDFTANYNLDAIESFGEIRRKAEAGDKISQKNLGNMYLDGRGTNRDYEKAMLWYRRSASQGYPNAIHNIGYLYESGFGVKKDLIEARKWYEKAAYLGLSNSQYILGLFLNEGIGGKRDVASGVEYIQRAAEQGLVSGQFSLAFVYQYGLAGDVDMEKSFAWYLKAAKNGDPVAALQLYSLYYEGRGVEKNDNKAFEWLELAEKLDDPGADLALGDAYLYGYGVAKDPHQAIEWLEKASAGDVSYGKLADYQLGTIYQSGVGVPVDYVKSAYWYKEALKKNNYCSSYSLGLLYLQGKGVEKSYEKGRQLLVTTRDKCSHDNIRDSAIEWLKKNGEIKTP
tara:strand:- start:3941 stop:8929 length:4989 start_codon:yes stop_codon:yes gene_type:complete